MSGCCVILQNNKNRLLDFNLTDHLFYKVIILSILSKQDSIRNIFEQRIKVLIVWMLA